MRVLVVEDDQKASDYLANALRESGHTVEQVADGLDGLHLARHERFDILIVDRMLPRLDGLTLIRSLREHQVSTPVLILSALDQVDDRVKGLRAGGDDYLTKPYHFVELLARIEALARRERAEPGATRLEVGDLVLDLVARRVTRADKRIELTAREFQLLEFLMRNAGQVVTRTMILEGVWDYHFDPQTNVIDVHISRLRQAVDRGFPRPLLHTVRGAGYVLREEE
jgi:two-component system OmpR family response regulator